MEGIKRITHQRYKRNSFIGNKRNIFTKWRIFGGINGLNHRSMKSIEWRTYQNSLRTLPLGKKCSISPDGEYLASGSRDKTIGLWKISSGERIKTLTGHTDQVYSVVFS